MAERIELVGWDSEYSNVTIPSGQPIFSTIAEASECYNLYILSGASMINTSPLTIQVRLMFTETFREPVNIISYRYSGYRS
ncbi:MAG: hypothetical protein IPN08_08385 [Bacteroidales bacterium]|nr:hypothetical protein [Bacteroidales bacterium]